MYKKLIALSCCGVIGCFLATAAQAICPLCTIAVGAGVGLAEWLGIDDTITGLWIGGLIVSLIIWTIYWLESKNIKFKGRIILVTLAYYVIVIGPLYPMGIMGHPLNKLWGIDKLLLGTVIGSFGFLIGSLSYIYMKKHNDDRAYFPFQKVVMAIVPLIILSIVFYFITR